MLFRSIRDYGVYFRKDRNKLRWESGKKIECHFKKRNALCGYGEGHKMIIGLDYGLSDGVKIDINTGTLYAFAKYNKQEKETYLGLAKKLEKE